MPTAVFPVNEAGKYGVITDIIPTEMPANAWSAARNMRFRNGYAEKFIGHVQVYNPPTVAPYWLLPYRDSTYLYWIYAGLAKVYVWNGATHTNITRSVGGDYAANAQTGWTGGVLGGVPFLNNGLDVPQMWNPTGIGNPLVPLSAWDANWKCGSLRSFKNYMIAVDVSKGATRYPYLVKWSHPADPGTVPSSWDETDETKDAGEYPIVETSGWCIDSAPMRDIHVVYKDDSVWGMQPIGGTFIFRFFGITRQQGILSRKCAVEYGAGQHAVFGNGDIFVHDGQNVNSIITRRIRNSIFSQIDPTNYQKSFAVHYKPLNEVWFCFPENGQTNCTKAWVWNYKDDTSGFRDLPGVTHIREGIVDPNTTGGTWDSDTGTWDSDTSTWEAAEYNPTSTGLLIADPTNTKLYQGEQLQTFNGTNMVVSLERTGLGVPVKANTPPDFSARKLVKRLWARIEGTQGGVVNVSCAMQDTFDVAPTWSASKQFVIGTTRYLDFLCNTRLVGFKFESSTDIEWRLHGYEFEVSFAGSL